MRKARPPVIYPNEVVFGTEKTKSVNNRDSRGKLPDCPVEKPFLLREQMYTQMLAITIPVARFSAADWSTFWRIFF
jgi:hypothetical protein